MANLTAVGFTVVAGACGFAISMISFGYATSKQSNVIAARCVARPKTVIYNPNPTHVCQDRGNVFWGWVPWVMKLTYATMLSGVPGTGTRDGGLSGLMLKVNLDGIVLMRFHLLCLRVSFLATILYILIVLPVFKTAQCSVIGGDFDSQVCSEQNATDYQRFTIANIPPLSNNTVEDAGVIGFFLPTHEGVLVRLYTVVFVSWIITWYTYVLLEKEWREVLALRRVYYLEADHWGDRNTELQETLLREEREGNNESMNNIDPDIESAKNYAKSRDPWVPHPEQRDTVPNIELYSVLVGGLPSLPTEAFLQEDVRAVFSRKQSIDWQLAVCSAFFDHCVPNQPGFSSSVAAVTILPAASQITEAWKHWYNTAAMVRRLRFIRKQITKRKNAREYREKGDDDGVDESVHSKSSRSFYRKLKKNKGKKTKMKKTSVYAESDEKKKYYSEVLGNTDDLEVEKNLLHALELGPEQTFVYSREFAQSAANMAPYGWNESKIRNAPLVELLEMEKNAATAVQEASHLLRKAQEKISETHFDGKLCNDEDLKDLMVSATAATKSSSDTTNDVQECEEGNDSNEVAVRGGVLKRSGIRQSWWNFVRRKASVIDVAAFEGIRNGNQNNFNGSKTTLRSLQQSLEVVAPRASLTKNPLSKHRNSSLSLDLGLEADLFLEQKNLCSGHSQQMPRTISKRQRSTDDSSAVYEDGCESEKSCSASEWDDLHSESCRSFRLAKDRDGIHIEQESVEVKVSQEFCKDEAKSKSTPFRHDVEEGIKSYTIEAPPLLSFEENEKDEYERKRLGYERMAPENVRDDPEAGMTSHIHSIWDKIASENDRIRKRLNNTSTSKDESNLVKMKQENLSDIDTIDIIKGKLTNHCTGNVFSISKADCTPYRRRSSLNDSRMFSINELSDKSYNSFEYDPTLTRTGIGSMRRLDRSGKNPQSAMMEQDVRLAHGFEEKAGLRRRQVHTTVNRISQTISEKWSKVIQIANESSSASTQDNCVDPIESGDYSVCNICSVYDRVKMTMKDAFSLNKWRKHSSDIVDPFDLAGESTFAVVTFTSRQAAVAARHCLTDSRGTDRWNTVSEMPSPPLADAPVCNLSNFRGCVRPVTISINDRQKKIRHLFALAILGVIYIFYIIPLTEVQQLLSPAKLQGILPDIDIWLQNDFMAYIFSGFIPALVWTGFYAICPPMFKAIANFGSNATSAACAEGSALRYFWWFMIVSAFTGTSLASAVIEGFEDGGLNLSSGFQSVIVTAASTVPTIVSATWLNWIIIRVSLVLPTQYILQMNTFLLSWLRLKVLARAVQGGGSGGPIPYRIYVDSGVVMLCLLALAPASPLIAIAAFAYFLFSVPMLRWVLIFLYKPKFDIGGARFPFIFDMCVSGMVAGHSLLGTMLIIRKAFGPAIVAFFPLIPTIFYRWILLNRYLKAFTDVALLQTSLLDGWDTNEESCVSKREEFRQFLVDCHKAAYVPVCIASDKATVITSEPAVVVPLESDTDEDYGDLTSVNTESHSVTSNGDIELLHGISRASDHQTLHHLYQHQKPQQQPGRMMRRASLN